MRRWKLRADWTAMENLFDACRVATYFMRQKYSSKLKLTKDEWDELSLDVELAAVRQFLSSKIGKHNYCREVSFYNNCLSCVMSEWSACVRRFLDRIKVNIDNVDKLDPEARQSLVDSARNLRYITLHDGRAGAQSNLRSMMSRSTNESYLKKEDEDDFWSYLECCEEFGITPNKNAPLYKRGRWIKY